MMGLRVLISLSRHWANHLRGTTNIHLPRLDLRTTTWRPFLTQQFSDSGQTKNEDVVTVKTNTHQATTKTKVITDDCLREFLLEKGAEAETIDDIISRYPRAVTRTSEHLKQMWQIWKSVLQTEQMTLCTLERSPESFFRSSDLENLQNNITFLGSLGLSLKTVCQLMTRSPRIFSHRVSRNRDMVELLKKTCLSLGGNNPEEFVRKIIKRNKFLLASSIRRIKANIEILQSSLKLTDGEMLRWIQASGAEILDKGDSNLRRNIDNVKEKLESLGCSEEDAIALVKSTPRILYLSSENANSRIDLLLKYGITMHQIVRNPRVFHVSIVTLQSRCEYLLQHGFDFQASGITVLYLSSKRFYPRTKKFLHLKDNDET